MNFLLDTHVFLWYITGDSRIHDDLLTQLQNIRNQVWLSVISEWEIIIKYQLGRLPLPEPPRKYIPQQRRKHGLASLSLDENAVVLLETLPAIHRDPFDRMLICQALRHDLVLVTADRKMTDYVAALSSLSIHFLG